MIFYCESINSKPRPLYRLFSFFFYNLNRTEFDLRLPVWKASTLTTRQQPLPNWFVSFLKKWANLSLFLFIFVLFTFQFKWQIYILNNINWKSIDGVLGIRTRGGRAEGADESTELGRHHHWFVSLRDNSASLNSKIWPVL